MPENALNSARVVLVLKCNTGLGNLNSDDISQVTPEFGGNVTGSALRWNFG